MCSFSFIFVLRMKKLYLFNPENDMALASGSPYYMAPSSAKKMAADLAVLPAWYAETGSSVWVSDGRQVGWLASECGSFLSVTGVLEREMDVDEVVPWGWSPALSHRLGEKFCHGMDIARIRALSSRRVAVDLLPLLRMEHTIGESFWLDSLENVRTLSLKYGKVLLKAPWSGSGKGIQPLSGLPDDNLCGWTKRVIASQGGVVLEPFYPKVKDFAMEFLASPAGLKFCGYSLFEADARGIYKENILASDDAIRMCLSSYVPVSVLDAVCARLQEHLSLMVDGAYQGYLGVDMMIVRTPDGYALHPCVEVNLRMNMGVVSRLFFDRYICPDAGGRYVIEYYPRRGDALMAHAEMKKRCPLVMEEGRIRSGYLSLTPVFEDTNYQIYVLVSPFSSLDIL